MAKKWKIVAWIFFGIIGLVLLLKLCIIAFAEPWLEKKIETTLREKYSDYQIEIDEVNILLFSLGIELETINIRSKNATGDHDLIAEIASVKIKRIDLKKYLSDKDIDIKEIKISGGRIKGEIPEPKEKKEPSISNQNIRIGKIVLNDVSMELKHVSSPQTYLVKGGLLNIYDIEINKKDTISTDLVKAFDFKAEEFVSVLNDSLYTIKAGGIVYEAKSKNLTVKDLIVHPNYSDYAFTARKKYQTDCIKAVIKNISFNDFSVVDYLKYKSLISSYIEVEDLDLHVFRDRRKEFHHVKKPMFQEMIYNYKGKMNIDSFALINGNLTYTEHVEQAVSPGKVNFNKISAKIYKISNDTIYKTSDGFFELKAHSYFMGKGKIHVHLKAKLYEPHNAFTLSGSLSAMDAMGVNPMLEKNAFIYVTAGHVDGISFNMRADNYKAFGTMTMLYHGLDVAVKSKKTNDTTAIKEKLISLVANKKIRDANPEAGENAREGIIDYERDPEKFLFNYCFKSILTGLKSSVAKTKNTKDKKHKK